MHKDVFMYSHVDSVWAELVHGKPENSLQLQLAELADRNSLQRLTQEDYVVILVDSIPC